MLEAVSTARSFTKSSSKQKEAIAAATTAECVLIDTASSGQDLLCARCESLAVVMHKADWPLHACPMLFRSGRERDEDPEKDVVSAMKQFGCHGEVREGGVCQARVCVL